ncbi:MAG TPA: hypothetical protein PKI61_01140 [bacterium]|nr:hypothetical protein [bacterium]HPT29723.1 hypothetical protein [bacterium]
MARGKFIVLYGINNLGKTTQAKKLNEKLNQSGQTCEHIKYPMYALEPTGPIINEYLRQDNPYGLSAREAQIFYTFNRFHYQPELQKKLDSGINIIAEDYIGTGIAWGMAKGVDKAFLQRINQELLIPDLAILMDGERFVSGIEKYHGHENDNDLTNRAREAHLELKEDYHWPLINANQEIEQVESDIWKLVSPLF